GSGSSGMVDGPPTGAKFAVPQGLAIDAADTVYVADRDNYRIRRVAPDGFTTTLAGSSPGYVDGPLVNAKFNAPFGLALEAATGVLYIADTGNGRVRSIKPDGTATTVCGAGTAGFTDGPCSSAQFAGPTGLAVFADGTLAVADSSNRRIRLIKNGTVTTLAGSGASGYTDGAASSATFYSLTYLAAGLGGELYISDYQRLRVLAGGSVTAVAGGGSSSSDGPATAFALKSLGGLVFGANQQLWLGDSMTLRNLTPTGGQFCDDLLPCTADACDTKTGKCTFAPVAATTACSDGSVCTASSTCDGKGACTGTAKNCNDSNSCTFDMCDALTGACDNHPTAATCSDGSACTQADTCVNGKCVVDQVTLTTVAGSVQGSADGIGSKASMGTVGGMVVQADGTVVFSDYPYHTIRQMTPAGKVTTVAGIAGTPGYQDGAAATAKFNSPSALAIDAQGRYVLSDTGSHRLRLVDPKTWQVTTIAGSGSAGYADGVATSATFKSPRALAIDAAGAIFVFDTGNVRIRKIVGGVVSTVAGSGAVGKQDGAATSASFGQTVWQMAFAADGSLYLADAANHAIRRLANGQVTTIVGPTAGFADGPLATARIYGAYGLAINSAGELFIGDTNNYRLRHVFLGDSIATESGNGTASQLDGLGTAGTYVAPTIVAAAANGIVYVADQYRIRRSTAAVIDCNDGKTCTADACSTSTGACSNTPIPDGDACSDGNACTSGETCTSGACVGGPTDCDDGNPCTTDSCDSKSGCLHAKDSQWQSCGAGKYCQFGQCADSPCPGKDPSACTGFVGSTLMSSANQANLQLMEGSVVKWKLCYKGSVDGFSSQVFHSKCDGLKPTLSVMHSTAGALFGGYASVAWSTNGAYQSNPGGWLFRLDQPQKFPITTQPSCAVHGTYSNVNYGPTFGSGHDLYLNSAMKVGYSNFPYAYVCPTSPAQCQNSGGACAAALSGTYDWQLDDVEVFYPAP
ncbi:MAG: TLD domain-containing protein, partial [Deltaproteobacteria bacterium]|nr:TLD domain-containing protein [Deltaproteobacteria bacterium]